MDGTVLIADDDRTIRTVLTQALTRAGCRVHATGSLGQLMRWVEDGTGDLVVTDVMMPDGNGLDMIPGISRNWRRTSSTTCPPTRPTACMASEAKRNGMRPPMKRPAITQESERSNVGLMPSLESSEVKPSKRTRAARPAEPIA